MLQIPIAILITVILTVSYLNSKILVFARIYRTLIPSFNPTPSLFMIYYNQGLFFDLKKYIFDFI